MFVAMLATVLARAYWRSETVHFSLVIKTFSQPHFYLGLFFLKEVYLDKEIETFTLGLFFFSVEVTFVQPLSPEEKEIMDIIKEKLKDMEQ